MKNHQWVFQFLCTNTDQAAKQVSALEHLVKSAPFKSYLQELAQKYQALHQTGQKHLSFIDSPSNGSDNSNQPLYMEFDSRSLGESDSDIAELLMQHSVLGIVQIKKQVRACQSLENFPSHIYNLLLELLDTEQFNLRCLQAFL